MVTQERGSSRDRSVRVDRGFHQRPNPWRRGMWAWSLVAVAVTCGGLGWAAWVREHRIYEGGPVTLAHRMFENDCQRCHTTWAPLQRLVSFDDRLTSVENAACVTCHAGPAHQANQVPAHRSMSCADCHREHSGRGHLVDHRDVHCVQCHGDLQTREGPSRKLARSIRNFGRPGTDGAHPEFAALRLAAASGAAAGDVPETHPARQVLEYFQRAGEPAPRWQDRARIRFNHAVHLQAEYGPGGQLVHGLLGPDGKPRDLSRNCQACHEPDAERRYLRPIQYERHCQECHPLLFDNQAAPGQTVPHHSPDVVRGFLTEFYTLRTLAGEPVAAASPEPLPRPLPGRPEREPLTPDQAQQVAEQVAQAERRALQHTHVLFGKEAQGGCRYCHEVAEQAPSRGWTIAPPRIPDRWLVQSVFEHESHRFLGCAECHAGVASSRSTGDVLLPAIASCQRCHTSSGPLATGLGRTGRGTGKARTQCTECHVYHHREGEHLDGSLNADLQPRNSPGPAPADPESPARRGR